MNRDGCPRHGRNERIDRIVKSGLDKEATLKNPIVENSRICAEILYVSLILAYSTINLFDNSITRLYFIYTAKIQKAGW